MPVPKEASSKPNPSRRGSGPARPRPGPGDLESAREPLARREPLPPDQRRPTFSGQREGAAAAVAPEPPVTPAGLRRQAAEVRDVRESLQRGLRLLERPKGKRPVTAKQRELRTDIAELEDEERRLLLEARRLEEHTEWLEGLGPLERERWRPAGGYQPPLDEIRPLGSYYSQAPSGSTHLVHRGDVRTEVRDGRRYVRVYQAVYAPYVPEPETKGRRKERTRGKDQGTYKDVYQDHEGRIRFRLTGDILWLNVGHPMRALYYLRSYARQGQRPGEPPAQPVIRSWLIPEEVYRQISSGAIAEMQAAELSGGGKGKKAEAGKKRTMNVDAPVEADQFGVMEPDIQLLRDTSLRGSLTSYVLQGGQPGENAGQVRLVDELLAEVEMPTSRTFPEFAGDHDPAPQDLVLPFDVGGRPLPPLRDLVGRPNRPNTAEEHRESAEQFLTAAQPQGADGASPSGRRHARQEAHLASLLERLDRMSLDDPDRRAVESAATFAWVTMYARDVYTEGTAAGTAAKKAGKEAFPTVHRRPTDDKDPAGPRPSTSRDPW
ncbi:hypothetical protein ACIPJQ_10495 [Streptomyces griseoviridis]